MKLRYFLPALLATVITVFTACSDNNDPTLLSEVRVSQSYLAFPADGGSVTITLTAADSWTVSTSDKKGMPDWVTITPSEGGAGTHELTFTATPATGSRDAHLFIQCGSVKQNLNLIQVTEKTEATLSPISTVLNGNDGTTYRVRGVCVTNPDNQYGNWDIEDETGKVYIYGTLDMKGAKGKFPISGENGWGFEVGDIITVEGPRSVYNGKVELVDVTVIDIEKSLIKVDSLDVKDNTLTLEGGDFSAMLVNKGNGIIVNIPEDAREWLTVVGMTTVGTTTTVKFHATPNAGGDRSTTLTFVTTDADGNEYSAQTTVVQKGSIVAATVAEFLAAEVGDAQYRLTGVISQLYYYKENVAGFYIKDYSGETLVYKAQGFTGTEAKVGDIVTVSGKRGAYKETPQLVSGTFEELKYSVTPVSIKEFLSKGDSKEVYYMVTGMVKDLLDNNGRENVYGNMHLTDGTNDLYVYGCYPGYGAQGEDRKGFVEAAGFEVGDNVTIIGYKDTYNGTVELCGGIFFSLEKADNE